jgi:hypothetical protein
MTFVLDFAHSHRVVPPPTQGWWSAVPFNLRVRFPHNQATCLSRRRLGGVQFPLTSRQTHLILIKGLTRAAG